MSAHPAIHGSLLRVLPLVVAGVLPVGCVISRADGRFVVRDEKRFQVDGKPDVKLSTRDGSIEVRHPEITQDHVVGTLGQ